MSSPGLASAPSFSPLQIPNHVLLSPFVLFSTTISLTQFYTLRFICKLIKFQCKIASLNGCTDLLLQEILIIYLFHIFAVWYLKISRDPFSNFPTHHIIHPNIKWTVLFCDSYNLYPVCVELVTKLNSPLVVLHSNKQWNLAIGLDNWIACR